MISIIIADDHQIVRDGIKALLEGAPEVCIAGEAGEGNTLLALLKAVPADICLLDISMPGESGIELCKKIQSNFPKVKVIILSMYSGEEFVVKALEAGAVGYLPKNISREELAKSIQEVYQGNTYISPSLGISYLNKLMHQAREKQRDAAETLSRREIEILCLCADGFTNKEIADKLFISVRTVESHKTHIMHKLELKTTADLIRFAIKNKLVNL